MVGWHIHQDLILLLLEWAHQQMGDSACTVDTWYNNSISIFLATASENEHKALSEIWVPFLWKLEDSHQQSYPRNQTWNSKY
jgi:hypothetical protein